ncbi:MAG: heliorhodopsin HeR [Clostridia bacterium]|nr:heliorhodopsin HeR [Clostridia bacterium]
MHKEITLPSLRRFNLFMGFLHLIQGGLMLGFSLGIDMISAFRPPLRTYFLTFDRTAMRLVTDPRGAGSLPFGVLVACFLLLSALAHFLIVMPGMNRIYNRSIENGINPFRWYEYALSSSIMIVLIASVFGVYAVDTLIAVFLLNACMNMFGLLMEQMNQGRGKGETCWGPFVFGCLAGLGPWAIVALSAFGNSDLGEVPWFVFAITFSYFFFFNLFPVNMVLQYKRIGRWADYRYGERGYIILSLVAKSVLAWLVFAGVMQP